MDFSQRRGRLYSEGEDQEESSQHQGTFISSSSSPSPSSSNLLWGPFPNTGPPSSLVEATSIEKEHMFDKVVTPSDVGKLNRLVIPKQHAERYFPLDSSTNEKGLLLNFEDRTGKPWRFRYSYWNSSQSYVMTKGWSRFVKEKRLDAGDTVSFGRGIGESAKDRLFIDWKRRPETLDPPRLPRLPLPLAANYPMVSFARSVGPWAGRLLVNPQAAYDHHRQINYGYNAMSSPNSNSGGQYLVFRSAVAPPPQVGVQPVGNYGSRDGTASVPMVLDSVPVVHSQAATKRFRLFGVDFPDPEDNSNTVAFPSSSSSSSPRKEQQP